MRFIHCSYVLWICPNASHCTSSRTIGVMNTTCQITLPKTRGARKIVVRSAIPGSWTGPSFTQQSLLHGAVMRRAKSSPQRLHPPRSPSGLSLLLTIKAGMERAEDLEGQDRKTGLGRPRLSSGLLAWPGLALALMDIWGINQWVEGLCLHAFQICKNDPMKKFKNWMCWICIYRRISRMKKITRVFVVQVTVNKETQDLCNPTC